jgi:hypothetical protein
MGSVSSTGVTACAGSRFGYEALTDPPTSGKIYVCILNRFTKMAFTGQVLTAIGFDMTTEVFRRRAADCLRWAQEAANERTKGLWLNMAQIWLDRAENPERIQQVRQPDNLTGTQRNLYGSA